ncbi:aldehyde dehydrogenase (NADP(+)) [Microbulbifer celer]|uniref:Aldehyde dehydrogenase (NADP(+)) n=1 Tax=Microbulbifer celer TaxID=435905 RepID=A0ABW3UDC0_9GAMM|nr:aldehyde dehydrogenase (NADP(+)) [Microbulbifer celer]UFN57523.1 aldehyde dehydrogenase (NADP(+)) [Microbulbifer celer]
MTISGKQLIAGNWTDGRAGNFHGVNPATGENLEPAFTAADEFQVTEAVDAASACATEFANLAPAKRAEFLNACADEIMNLGDELLERVSAETGYPRARAEGERGRTCGQLRLFADWIVQGEYLDARIDVALPDRQPLPRPDLRSFNQALGPVAVFGASNFPLAFSVAGGDTAAAFAAGCPVIVKAHNSHPGTSELVAQAIDKAVKSTGMPAGVFSLILGSGRRVGAELVKAPGVKAVGFTGSLQGGMALFNLANARPEPIPVFAEMGSINPVVLLPEALKEKAETIAEGFVGSLTLGTGQFCVNPGLVLAVEGEELDRFIAATGEALSKVGAGVMLNENTLSGYQSGVARLRDQDGVEQVAAGEAAGSEAGFTCQAGLLTVDGKNFLANKELQEEVFGPMSLVVKCRDQQELLQAVSALQGQLTGTLQCTESELANYGELVEVLRQKVGRVVCNNFPTGVEVCHSMMHGGPFPAATDARFTSVGTMSIARFVRPICFQNYPEALLPDALKNSNPLNISRLVNGEKSSDAI